MPPDSDGEHPKKIESPAKIADRSFNLTCRHTVILPTVSRWKHHGANMGEPYNFQQGKTDICRSVTPQHAILAADPEITAVSGKKQPLIVSTIHAAAPVHQPAPPAVTPAPM
jgi:hypothetical protein